MKIKITNKAVNSNYDHVIMMNECPLYWKIKSYFDAQFYNAGVYGWNYDLHVLTPSLCVVSGYRNFPSRAVVLTIMPAEVKRIVSRIEKIQHNNWSYDTKCARIRNIIISFLTSKF